MFRQFLRDSATYGLATIVTKGLALALVPVYTRILSPRDYGSIDLLTVVATLINLTVALEVSQGLARFYPGSRDPGEGAGYASTALWFTVATFSVALVIGLILSDRVASLVVSQAADGAVAVRLAFLGMWAGGIFYLVLSQLRWELRPRSYAAVSVGSTAVAIVVSIVLVVGMRAGLVGVLAGQLVGNLAGAGIGLVAARRSYRLMFDRSKLRVMLRFSLPLVPSGLSVFVTLYVDRILIGSLMSIADVGVFGIAYRLSSVTNLIMIVVQTAITPIIYSRHEEPETPAAIARIFRYFVAGALLAGLGVSLFAPALVAIAAPASYAAAAGAVPLLVPAIILAGMYVFAPGLALGKKTGAIAAINIVGAVSIAALNALWIPSLGIIGSAAADLVGGAGVFLVYLVLGQRTYPIPHDWQQLASAIAVAVAGYLIGANVHAGGPAGVAVNLAILAVVGITINFLGLFHRSPDVSAEARSVPGPG